jgi:hypothetical protein
VPARRVAIGAVLFAALAVCGPVDAAVRPDFVGVTSKSVGDFSAAAAAGAGVVRQTFDWSEVEKARGSYEFQTYDQVVGAAARRGIRMLPVLFNPPAFRSRARPGADLPANAPDFAAFATGMVQRYGPGGRFWRDNPLVPALPIVSWQVWNEPNYGYYWPRDEGPEEYAAMLRAVSAGIRSADPHAEVVTAGLATSEHGLPPAEFLERMYEAGAKGSFDTLAMNAYAPTSEGVMDVLAEVRRIMDSHGDRGAKIWVTELGWSDAGPASDFRAGPGGQATQIARTFQAIGERRKKLGIRGLIYYAWRDGHPYPPAFKDFWGLHTGLLRVDGSAKAAFWAFQTAARKLLSG